MTGKERVEAVFAGRMPDRPPIWEQGFASQPASEILGRPAHTGGGRFRFDGVRAAERGPGAAEDFQRQAWRDQIDLAGALDWDLVSLGWGMSAKPSRWIDDRTFLVGEQEQGKAWAVYRFDESSDTLQEIAHYLDNADISEFEEYVQQAECAAQDRPSSDEIHPVPPQFAALVPPDAMLATGGCMLAIPYRPPRWLEVLHERHDLIERLLDLQVESARVTAAAAARQGARFVNGGGDFCYNSGPMYSPRIFHDLMLPRLQEIVRVCNEHNLWYVWRTDGWTWPVADDLFHTSGVHGYGEIDAQAGMDLAELRQHFPNLVLVGGIDCGQLLQNGTPEQIAAATRSAIEIAGPRYIVGSSNVIHSGIPAENYMAMWKVAVDASSQYCYAEARR
ncbi:MAG: hypothetical protein GW893_21670 [Armatimonadetes bacterium]|nr:hypothetical protein [Armatimonadota bacterium]PIU64885.1 MAG: hypothetical protein COS85_10855 [Armatimonadetes bacterium CG07_land_8_20_14_0_80_59_28]PIX42121.1 MAG: hypothetical protein COZ56_10100 [Armatimonadetes bacterium CG_4_8_14_3_um_filter_58_9]PIY47142.1 MAG: hypothetical protein COZ05_05220 [Armatimonadetes bacterium CG_4_10_14_3_um_filter_59_10]